MKRLSVTFITIMFCFAAHYVNSEEKPGGEEIARMIMEASKSTSGLMGTGVMDVIDIKSDKSDKRNFIILISFGKNEINSIFRFTDPKLNMATFYNKDVPGKPPVSYMYFKNYKQPLQIQAQQQMKNFLDTDISMEDLGNIKVEDYTYKRLNDVTFTIDGQKRSCYLIERYPKKKTAYSKHVVLVDKEWLLPVVYKSYNDSGRIVKKFMASNIKKINDKLYMPFKIQIVNLEKKHQTNVTFNSIEEKKVVINVKMMTEKWNF